MFFCSDERCDHSQNGNECFEIHCPVGYHLKPGASRSTLQCIGKTWLVKELNKTLHDPTIKCEPHCGTLCEGEGFCSSPGTCTCPKGRKGMFCERLQCNETSMPKIAGSETING